MYNINNIIYSNVKYIIKLIHELCEISQNISHFLHSRQQVNNVHHCVNPWGQINNTTISYFLNNAENYLLHYQTTEYTLFI